MAERMTPDAAPGLSFRAAELLASRLCHDLISPIAAINNGVELIEEGREESGGHAGGPGSAAFLDEALALIADSGKRAAAVLRFYRAAYGSAGSSLGSFAEVGEIALGFLELRKVALRWPGDAAFAALAAWPAPSGQAAGALSGRWARVVLNGCAALAQLMPQGGNAALTMIPGDGGPSGAPPLVALSGTGRGAKVEAKAMAALAGDLGDAGLDAALVQFHYLGRWCRCLGLAAYAVEGDSANPGARGTSANAAGTSAVAQVSDTKAASVTLVLGPRTG